MTDLSIAAKPRRGTRAPFPHGEGFGSQRQIELAQLICAGCPVRPGCLAFALATDVQCGIWAGTTPSERRTVRHRAGMTESLPRRVVRRSPAELAALKTAT
ncbi:MAG: putative transcription factor WhiB family [Marmoricola sp.]|nr:putative transcription factor WhiB family [Marmoricola sp.]